MPNTSEPLIEFDELLLCPESRTVLCRGKLIYLRNKEFTLLEYFMGNVGRVLSRTQILEDVWDRNYFGPTNTVDVHVSNLRKKLFRRFDLHFLKTVYCIGYLFDR